MDRVTQSCYTPVIGVEELPAAALDEPDYKEILAGRIVFSDGPGPSTSMESLNKQSFPDPQDHASQRLRLPPRHKEKTGGKKVYPCHDYTGEIADYLEVWRDRFEQPRHQKG